MRFWYLSQATSKDSDKPAKLISLADLYCSHTQIMKEYEGLEKK